MTQGPILMSMTGRRPHLRRIEEQPRAAIHADIKAERPDCARHLDRLHHLWRRSLTQKPQRAPRLPHQQRAGVLPTCSKLMSVHAAYCGKQTKSKIISSSIIPLNLKAVSLKIY
jgi:hypothetical protein